MVLVKIAALVGFAAAVLAAASTVEIAAATRAFDANTGSTNIAGIRAAAGRHRGAAQRCLAAAIFANEISRTAAIRLLRAAIRLETKTTIANQHGVEANTLGMGAIADQIAASAVNAVAASSAEKTARATSGVCAGSCDADRAPGT